MARMGAFLFCRYEILDDNEKPLSADEELRLLEGLKGKTIAYRVREPKPDDVDTYLLKPRKNRFLDTACTHGRSRKISNFAGEPGIRRIRTRRSMMSLKLMR